MIKIDKEIFYLEYHLSEGVKMKRFLALVLCVTVCVSFAGCEGKGSAPAPTAQTEEMSFSDAKVSFLGPEGTYTQEACEQFFAEEGKYLPYETVGDAVKALVNGDTDYAVIPQENTIGGAVIDYVDTLIGETSVYVTGEVELPINQNLLVLPGTDVSEIKTVYSHKQGIAQGKEWLQKNVPDAEVIEVSSTAEGAKRVAEEQDASCAAIASAGCADVYGLQILAEAIQNNEDNKTRFYVLTKNEPAAETGARTAFIASGAAKDLPKLIAEINAQKMTLITIHDRPRKTQLGQYNYLIECENGCVQKFKKLAKISEFEYRYLGSFEVR